MLVAALLGVQLLVGVSADASRAALSQPAVYSVGVTRCTFVDRTRPVLNYATTAPAILSHARTLVTEIRYPTLRPRAGATESPQVAPVQRMGGFPMIVFAHGYDVTPDIYARLLDAWVKAGFVVAAPLFPDENKSAVAAQHGANTEMDLWNEPADIAFVTRQILLASVAPSPGCPLVRGLVRARQIGLAGHSDGATAVGILTNARGSDPQGVRYQDLRAGLDYRATVIMSGKEDGVDPYATRAPHSALLVIQSAADQCNPAFNAVKFYRDINQANKWFLELRSAHHLPPFDGRDAPAFAAVARASIRFFQTALDAVTPASNLLAYDNSRPSVALMFHGGGGPTMANAPAAPTSCGLN